jgi:apolipoprotein N-acyltransferase
MTRAATRSEDRVAAWATAAGIGLMAFMITWLLVSRVTALFWEAPAGPVIAMSAALLTGAFTTGLAGRRLAR